ncbi:Cell morphoproteinsis protein PAG1 [Sporothrix bragantina]|uniref:Cell morphoproteinsis protein PAG1 n=1 Tax=Sporothrix bragantina TaxID=671064 RepID=A0ABP0D1Z0_9PEZI
MALIDAWPPAAIVACHGTPSQTLPEHAPDPLKFSTTPVSRLVEEDEEDDWNRTLRPGPGDVPPTAPRLAPTGLRIAHSRESSAEKLQQQQQAGVTSPSSVSSSASFSQLHTSSSRLALNGIIERAVDPKAAAYGHHRQTSIVHGIQHSRNGSLASSSSSPLSPQMIAAAGASFSSDRSAFETSFSRLDGDSPLPSAALSPPPNPMSNSRPPTAMSGSNAGSGPGPAPSANAIPGSAIPERTSSVVDINNPAYPPPRKLERMHSGKYRHDHSHTQSHSRHYKDEQKTVGEYALHVLFTSFISIAEEKLNECVTTPLDSEPSVESICGPGADAAFDQHLAALGHIAKQKPKPLIDIMMLWRKSKSDAANDARAQLQQARAQIGPAPLQRRNTEPVQTLSSPGIAESSLASPTALSAKQEFVAQAERKSTVSIYVLCRVLLEVITQSSLASITPEMEDKLEAIIFGQLKMADADQLLISPLRMSNWNLFAQLLGAMSEISFATVTDRFINDLERSLQEINFRSPVLVNRSDSEEKMELVLGGMKHLRLKLAPASAWDQSCDFMIALGKLFSRCHGQKVKAAFCQIFDLLLLPVAANASNSDFSRPKWGEVLSTISPRLAQMFVKPRHWACAFPLTATMLCTSPPDSFGNQWLQLVYPLQTRLKDRASKPLSLQVLSRIVWTYLYRTTDTVSGTIRKLEEVLKLILPSTKRSIVAADTAVVEPLIQIIRFIGFKHPEFCFKTIIFPLINAELFTVNRDLKVENLEPDRIVVGIRAFLAVISDLERGAVGRPPFPQSYTMPASDRTPTSPTLGSPASSGLIGGIANASARARATSVSTTNSTNSHDDQLSRPVATNVLTDTVRDYYSRFCEILGKITIICDNTFGGQAALDEKFSSPGPKTPIAETFNFARREDHQNPTDQKQAFYELLHVAVQALPRCLSPEIPFNSLINLLCTGTAHIQSNIAESSAQSLKAIAGQSHAQQVTMGFSRFIFNFDDRYATMSDGGMLGADHIENTLRLYIELLQIWIEEIQRKTKDVSSADAGEPGNPMGNADKRGMKLDLSSIWAEVDQVEAHGLFFLCSQSRRVRAFAITVLRLISKFDTALGKPQTDDKDNLRVIDILENESSQIMNFNDEYLTVAERSRLQRGLKSSGSQGAVIELCASDLSYDATLWFKVFPNLIRVVSERCIFAVTIGRDLICNRILQMYRAITIISEPSRGPYYGADPASARYLNQAPITQPELVVEQWRLYLIFACTTLQDPGNTPPNGGQASQHGRKNSNKSSAVDRIVSARTLFKYLNPLLSVSSTSVRDAVVAGMGSININIYRTLLEELQGHVSRCNDEARARIHQRTNSSPRRNKKMDLLRTEITHVYRLTAHFLKLPEVYNDDWVLNNLVLYARDIKLFLMDGEVQLDIEFQRLRRHYCGLMEELYTGINRSSDPSRWMTFEARKSSFTLMEDWCGFSPNQNQLYQRDENGRLSMIDQHVQPRVPDSTLTAAMEIEKRHLRTAALSAMAALCGGPISVTTESGVSLQFDMRRLFAWIEDIFMSGNDRMRLIGRQALNNLIVHNKEHAFLLEHSIGRCYLTESTHVLECYFEVVIQVLLEHPDYPSPFWRLLGLCLFTLGNEQSEIRSKSVLMLRALEERQNVGRGSKIQDFDISVSDKTKAVYKLAQYKISERLSKQHTEVAFHIFSEFTYYFKDLQQVAQRNVIAVILPWIQSIELKVDPNGGPTAESYVLLANLLEITIKSSGALHNEVQALWQALATGPHPGNVRLILDFIMALCLERREQNFVEYAKQIVVFLASTNSAPGQKVIEFLLMQITPKAMVPNEKRETMPPPPDANSLFPYCADLNDALPVGTKQAGFSLGQLSLILLVDLMVSPVILAAENVPILLQVVTVLWDHYTPLVQEQAREMLVHLIHELVVSNIDDKTAEEAKAIEGLVELIRRHDKSVVWGYEDSNGKEDDQDSKVPPSMEYLTAEVVKTFEMAFPGIKEQWGRLSLTWATSCPVRHLACRSFQIFRCILTSLDQYMLADMLARLSNTIADEDSEIRTFSMEILTTLKTLIVKLDADKLLTFPQLFWTTCACLESINEREFLEAVDMLNQFLDKLDFQSPNVRHLFLDGQPSKWDGPFEGLQPLLYKGLRSSLCFDATLKTLDKLVRLPSDPLVGDDDRLFLTLVANLPRFLQEMEQNSTLSDDIVQTVQNLLGLALSQGHGAIAMVLDGYLSSTYDKDGSDFAMQMFGAFQEHFLPRLDFPMITMLLGFLTNDTAWIRLKTMRILCVFIPQIDMRQPEIAGHGSDLLSPLLRLLPTEYCMEALQVLDNIMTMSGSSMDKHHIRMSMTRATSKSIRKEYERTQSLFGIPEESGWAIPMPAKKTDSTRANIHAVFYSCQNAEGVATEPTPTPDVEFHIEEFPYLYYPAAMERTDTMMSDDAVRSDVSVTGDLASKLDSLDDFFDDIGTSPPSDSRSSTITITEAFPDGAAVASGAQLYDEIVPLLHQASNPTTNLQNAFADRPPGSRDGSSGNSTAANTMNPGAFNFGTSHVGTPIQGYATRPSLHARSITSPSAPASVSASGINSVAASSSYLRDFASDDEDAFFSDVEDDRHIANSANGGGAGNSNSGGGGSAGSAGSFGAGVGGNGGHGGGGMFETMIRPLAQSTRSRMRRLTGSRSRDEKLPDIAGVGGFSSMPGSAGVTSPGSVSSAGGAGGGGGSDMNGGVNMGGMASPPPTRRLEKLPTSPQVPKLPSSYLTKNKQPNSDMM